jgi:hypothetical protein
MYPQSTVELARALSSLGALDRENAAICGVSVAAIRHWRRGSRRPSVRVDRPTCPRCHARALDERAYSYLLGLYLGDGHLTLGQRSVYALSITCCDGWSGVQDQARAAMAG